MKNFAITFLALGCLIYIIPKLLKRVKIQIWRRHLHLDEHQRVFQQLFSNVDGFFLSKRARQKSDALEYVYGEIEFSSFIALLSLTQPTEETIFYDLGSGVGKAVFACAMVFDVKKCCGVELFSELHQAALDQQKRLQQMKNYVDKSKKICFLQQNFLATDFSDATLIFINATGLFGETWDALNTRLANVNPKTIILTTSKKLPSSLFTVIRTTTVQMSWGNVYAYIQTRNPSSI
jgi:hypothetical protein